MKAYDREHMKMAMLKHEETFKQQVYELHRLYRVQKMLMKGVEHNKQKSQNQQRLNRSNEISVNHMNSNPCDFHEKHQPRFNLDHPVEDYIKELNRDKELEIEDESEIQLTLGPTRYNTKKKTETSDSGPSFSSSSTGSSHIIKGTHQGPHQHQENLAWGLTMVTTDSNSSYHSAMKNGYRVQDQPSQGRLKQPLWLLQALSLNMS